MAAARAEWKFWPWRRCSASRARLSSSPGLFFRVPGVKNGAAGDQQVGAGLDHRGDGLVSHAPIDLDSEVQIKFGAQFDQPPDLIQ